MNVRLMSDLDLQGKTVVFREDLNVPVKEGKITSDKRIRAARSSKCWKAKPCRPWPLLRRVRHREPVILP